MGTKKNPTSTASESASGGPTNGKKIESVGTPPTGPAGSKKRVSPPLPPSAAAFKLTFSLEDFTGSGFLYKGKLVGTETVNESKGNDMAQKTFGILRKRVSAAKKHKLRVLVYLSLKGIRVVNEKNASVLVEAPINKITFFTRDLACQRTYGIVVCVADLQYRFVAIKAERSAEVVVVTIGELFDVAALAQKQQNQKQKTATMMLLNERAIDVPIEQQQRLKDDLNYEIKYDVTTVPARSESSSKGHNKKSLVESSNSNNSMDPSSTEVKTTSPSGANPVETVEIPSIQKNTTNDGGVRPHSVANTREGGGRFKGAFSKLFASSKRNSMVEIGQLDNAEFPEVISEDRKARRENKKRGSRQSVTSVESAKSSRVLRSLRSKNPVSKSTVDMSASEDQTNRESERKERVFQSSKKGRRSKSGSAKKASRSSKNSQDVSAAAFQPHSPTSPLGESSGVEENLFTATHSSSPNLDCLLEFDASEFSNGCNKESDLFDPFRNPPKTPQNPNSTANDFDPFSCSTGDIIQQDYSLFNDPRVSANDSAFGSGLPWFIEPAETSKPDSKFSKSLGSLNIFDSFGQEAMFNFTNPSTGGMESGLDAFGSHVFVGNEPENERISFEDGTNDWHKTSELIDQNEDDDVTFGFKLTSEARDMSIESNHKSRRESTKRTLKSHSMSNLLDDVTFFYSADWEVSNGDDLFVNNHQSGEVFNGFDDVIVSVDSVDDDSEDDENSESGSKVIKSRPLHKSVANLDDKFSMRAASVISANFSAMSQTYGEKPVLKTLQVLRKPFDDDPFFLS